MVFNKVREEAVMPGAGKKCKHCGSGGLIKYGHNKYWSGGKRYRTQRYLCNNCGRYSFGAKEPVK